MFFYWVKWPFWVFPAWAWRLASSVVHPSCLRRRPERTEWHGHNHAHVLKAKNGFSDASLYVFLSNMQMQTNVTGAAQPKINQENLRSFPVVVPVQNILEEFNSLVDPLFLRISENNDEIEKLERLKGLFSNQLVKGA